MFSKHSCEIKFLLKIESAKHCSQVLEKKKIIVEESKEKTRQEFEKRKLIHEIKEKLLIEQKFQQKRKTYQSKWYKFFAVAKVAKVLRSYLFVKLLIIYLN